LGVNRQPSHKIGDTMPRNIVRHTIFDELSIEEAEHLFRQLDWKELEQCLGVGRLPNEVRAKIAALACVMKGWRAWPPLAEVRRKTRSFKQKAQKLREFIGGSSDPIPEQAMKSPKTVEAYFFLSLPSVTARPDPQIELMKKALDTVIAASDVANSQLTASRTGLSLEKWLAAGGYMFRDELKNAELPHKVRKDTDKTLGDNQNSPFVNFYLELLKQIGMPWPSTPTALAAALHKIFRDDEARKKIPA
jgi:hypothetical protein